MESHSLLGKSNAKMTWPLGKIDLSVRAGTKTLDIEFPVVDVPFPYNAIIGRTWLHNMGAISLTYHQLLCYSIGEREKSTTITEHIKRDQVMEK